MAYAEFPELDTLADYEPDEALDRDSSAGNVYLNTEYRADFRNTSYKKYILLHEIGHALGLKHPFHTSPYNRKKLSQADDHTDNTVMSYDNRGSEVYPTKIRALDKAAVERALRVPEIRRKARVGLVLG